MVDLIICTMSEYDNFESIDALDQLLDNSGVAVPDKKDGNPKKKEKEKESSGMKPGKEKVAPGRSELAEKNLDVVEHKIYLTKRESTLLRLISSVSGKSMNIVVRESLAVVFRKFESWITKRGISDLDRIREDYEKEF